MWMTETFMCHMLYLTADSVENLEAQMCDGNVQNYEVSDGNKDTRGNLTRNHPGDILVKNLVMFSHVLKT